MAAAFVSVLLTFNPTQISPTLPHNRLRRLPSANQIFAMSSSNQSAYFFDANADISSILLRSIPATVPSSVASPIRRLISSAPPTIAPSLCLAASQLVGGGSPDLVLNTACALHLIHAASHTHAAVINHRSLTGFSPGVELMTGDGLLALGYEMVARATAGEPEVASKLQKVLVEVATTAAAVAADENGKREGRLAACAAACGVILGGGREEEVERARRLGMYAGRMQWDMAEMELEGFPEVRAAEVRRLIQENHKRIMKIK